MAASMRGFMMKWPPHRRAQVSAGANERYLQGPASVEDGRPLGELAQARMHEPWLD
jgi:hypothetical protein